ncbi:MAG: hypothetical protein ABSD38_01130 [Syntrophorhabdales bacterium]|jgi:hypothetical protein
MKKENTEVIEGLQWFVDFANLNLDNLKPGDKAKFFVEARQYLWPGEEEFRVIRGMGVSWVLAGLPEEGSEQYWGRMRELQERVRTVLDYFSTDERFAWSFNNQTVVQVVWEPNGRFTFSHVLATHDHPQYVEVKLYGLLDGLSLAAVRRCPGCQKFFLNPTGRKKRFCGNRCMWRISTAERREADREEYNEYQKGLMTDLRREKAGLKRLKTKARKTAETGAAQAPGKADKKKRED